MTTDGAQWWWPCDLPAYRITEIPREDPADTARDPDPGRVQRAAALTAAYHAGIAADGTQGAIAFGWIRTVQGGRVHVIAAGHALAGSAASAGDVFLSLPGGARGRAVTPDEMTSLLSGIGCWRDIAAISDGLLAPARGAGTPSRSAGNLLDSCLLGSWAGPFGWLVLAEPLPGAELGRLADDTARRLHLAEAAADRFPERAVAARRLTARHAEFRQGFSSGFWRIRVCAGGEDAVGAARVAGLCCASAGLDGLPYTLTPAPGVPANPVVSLLANPAAGVPANLADGDSDRDSDRDSDGGAAPMAPFRGSTELLAALARAPGSEVPGIRLALRPDFDVTPETAAGAAVPLGDILDRNLMPTGSFGITLDSLNRHVFVCGATGAGKSQTVRSLLEAATAQGIPWLVIEPAKAEYRLMANRVPSAEVVRIRPGEADAIAAGLNPLEPATSGGARFPLQTHADLVRALFVASFRSEEPFPQVLSAALTRVYEEAGWDLVLGEPRGHIAAYPTLAGLQRAAERVVADIGYSQRVTDDVLGFIRVRIASLRAGTTGRFLEGGHPVGFGNLLRRNVVLELEDIGDDRDKAFLMGTVLIRLVEHLRLTSGGSGGRTGRSGGLRHLTVVEEAHRLLRRTEPGEQVGAGAHAVEMFAGLLAEIRAYGEGLIVAEQIPARVIVDVVKNSAVKITHRLPAADDRDAVGATMNVTPAQSRYLVTLPPGQAAVFTDGMDFPILVKVKDSTERELVTPPSTRSPEPVVTPRSATCGTECTARPCTLREMRGAQNLLMAAGGPPDAAVPDAAVPGAGAGWPGGGKWLAAWAELTVLAHLTGWPMPVPKPPFLASFAALPPRLAQCAVSHAVDAAVAARIPALADRVDPSALAAHACAAIAAHAGRPGGLCEPDESGWRLPGPVTEAVTLGTARPSALESAGSLAEVLSAFVDCQWPLPYLAGLSGE